jgi:outer membrane protein OmpA-like peptidoglycan-associated protein
MKTLYKMALTGAAMLTLSTAPAIANDYQNGFTSHHLVDEKNYEPYAASLSGSDKLELREYLDYEQREPCQFYQPIPEGFVRDGCHLKREMVEQAPKTVAVTSRETIRISNVLTDYELNFAFDSAALEPQANVTLDRIASEIKKYSPREVIVAGYTDTAGPSAYNVKLSERRAQAVSGALHDRGIANRVLDKEAYGESKLAVDTKNNVALRENRRVVVEFRK